MPRVIASIEARMGSSRLPGKILMDVRGKPTLERLVERLRRAKALDGIVLATTTEPADDVVEAWAAYFGVEIFRGSEDDVLARVVGAQQAMASDIVVEVTGDCPLLDPEIIDLGVTTYLNNAWDVVSNTAKLSFPMGLDVQVFSLALLEEVERTVHDPVVREHVSLYFYEHPERYRIHHLMAPPRWTAPTWRFQLDYPEDHVFISRIYEILEPLHGPSFGVEEVFALLRKEPSLIELNLQCEERAPR